MKKVLLGAVGVASLLAFGAPAWAQQCPTCPQPQVENYTYQETVPQQTWYVPAHTQTVPAYKVGGTPTGQLVSNCPETAYGGYGAYGAGVGLGGAGFGTSDYATPGLYGTAAGGTPAIAAASSGTIPTAYTGYGGGNRFFGMGTQLGVARMPTPRGR